MTNIDSVEISRFEDLAGQWWDPEGDFKPLHQINPLRLEYVDQRFPLDGKNMLDLGCGGGLLAESMSDRGASVMGLDAGSAPIAVAKLHARETDRKICYQKGTAEELLKTHTAQFDGITCMEMLEHVPHPDQIITACAQLVRPGGSLFFSTINRNPKSWLFAIVGAEYLLGLLPRGTHRYDRFIRPSELESWATDAGLKLLEMAGLHYNPLFQQYSIGPGTDVNYILHFIRHDSA
jgi:2-polyprenyl-6-hydroxyphenyl methylase/3-demethylubiquinone-9 3-methyltransferase